MTITRLDAIRDASRAMARDVERRIMESAPVVTDHARREWEDGAIPSDLSDVIVGPPLDRGDLVSRLPG